MLDKLEANCGGTELVPAMKSVLIQKGKRNVFIFTDGAINSSFIPLYKDINNIESEANRNRFSGAATLFILVVFLFLFKNISLCISSL